MPAKPKQKKLSSIEPGKTTGYLETPEYIDSIKLRIPVLSITGNKPGPMVVVLAGQHGRELNGIAAIYRAFHGIEPGQLKGRIVFLPVLNTLAVQSHRQDFPVEESRYLSRISAVRANFNMNRTWPVGLEQAPSLAASVTALVWDTYCRHADLLLDLHAWSAMSLSLVWGRSADRALIRGFGLPCYQIADEPSQKKSATFGGMARKAGIPTLIAELTGQNTVDFHESDYGCRGILNLLKVKKMLPGQPELPPVQYEFCWPQEEMIAETPVAGLVVPLVAKGSVVKRGQSVLKVISLHDMSCQWHYKAPARGLVFNIGSSPWGTHSYDQSIVYPGQRIAVIKPIHRVQRNAR